MELYRVSTQEDYNDLMEHLENEGCFWLSGDKPTELNYFNSFSAKIYLIKVKNKRIEGTTRRVYPDVLIIKWEARKMKNINWAKEQVHNNADVTTKRFIERKKVVEILNQIEEPKIPTIPEYVANFIKREKIRNVTWLVALHNLENRALYAQFSTEDNKVGQWIHKDNNADDFVRAWITNDYEVEQDPKYRAKIKELPETLDNDSIYFFTSFEGVLGGTFADKDYSSELTKEEWKFAGVHDGNATFEKVEEEK